MSASDESTQRDPLDLLVEQFLGRHRKGEVMDVEAFAAAHPAHATELRELLPTLQALEQVKREKESTGGKRARVSLPAMQQLGDFKIVRELGRGGMGVVFEAVQESLGRKVALKVLPQASLLTGSQLQRFLREAQIAAQLHHSNIVPVFGSGESDGYHWYAMQHIAGQSLDRWRTLQAEQPPQGSGAWRSRARFVARIGVQAASALHYAHSQGTLHRDVKPGNLLLEDNEHLWVTDFGLAKALEAEGITHSGDLLGTLQYMAPEQFAGHYDARSEVYALGITLYELLVLKSAFAAKTRSELMERIRTQRPDSLRRLRPEVPEDLAIVIERAMARDPADRYRDAHELEQDLQAFLEDRPIAARRQNALGLVLRWCRHNRAMATLAASTLFAMVGAGILGWVAYVVSNDALEKAEAGRIATAQEKTRADANVRLALAAFGDVFDTLVGRDPMLAIDEDPDTGEQTVIARTVVDPKSIDLLQKMLDFLGEFTAQNAENQALRFETARAYRRVGSIHARLGRPENLARAVKAYEQALRLLDDVTEKDVTREIAAVQVDFGQLQFRQGDRQGARQRFQRALNLLEGEHGREGRALQFELAQAHFLLARLADRTGEGGPGQRGPGPGGLIPPGQVSGGDVRREVVKFLQTSKEHLQSALATVAKVLEDDPDNREFLALKARCLLLDLPSGPMGGGGRRERTRDAAADAQHKEGIAILRTLVEKNAGAEQLRLELCKALIEDHRREGPPRGRRGDPAPGDRPGPTEEEMLAVREAKAHAEVLLTGEPLSQEYKALRAEVGILMGRMLRDRSEQVPEPLRADLGREATAELVAVVDVERGLVNAETVLDPRFLGRILDSRILLATLHFNAGRKKEGVEQMQAVADLLEGQVAMLDHGAVPRPMMRVLGGQLETGRVARIEDLLRSAGEGELLSRLQKLREKLQPPPPESPDGSERHPPPDSRRPGK